MRYTIFVCLGLTALMLVIYSQVIKYEFTNFDDNAYVYGNGQVRSGLTLQSLSWSLHSTHSANWHPLTWLSHMFDAELYGLNAGGHHLTNLLIHIANTLLLFILLRRICDAFWPSAFVAALFALHPLHVESVAWVAERKDLLSTFFGMLALISYTGYVRKHSRSLYGLTVLCFILSLMAKPMLVTMPFLLLLLDYWPLGRVKFISVFRLQTSDRSSSGFSLLFEKLPFFLLAGASCVVTYYAQQSGGAVVPFELYPLGIRFANALLSYVAYIGKMFWPVQLAVFYPYPNSFAALSVAAAAVVLLGISIGTLVQIRQRPYLAVGWFWYLGTLVPVIGIIQVGGQAMADRYTYIPLIGLFIMVSWGTAEVFDRWKVNRFIVALTTVTLMLTIVAVSRMQAGYWANSITLFSHALKVTQNNYLAHLNLGKAFNDAGRGDEARRHYAAAVEINPYSAPAHVNFASALLAQGKIDEAVNHLNYALKINPDFAEANNNMGLAHLRQGQIDKAIYFFRIANQKNPSHKNTQQNLNLAISIQKKINKAVERMRQSLNIDTAESRLDLKIIELSEAKRELIETVNNFQKALARQPGFIRIEVHNISAVSMVMKEYESSFPLFLTITKSQPMSADAHYHIACILARKGSGPEARNWLSRAQAIDRKRWDFYKTDPDLQKNLSKILPDIQ